MNGFLARVVVVVTTLGKLLVSPLLAQAEGDVEFEKPTLAKAVHRLRYDSRNSKVLIDPAEREELIEYAKKQFAKTGLINGAEWLEALFILGDEKTIRDTVRTEDNIGHFFRELSYSGSPVAIEVVMPYIFKEEPLVYRHIGDALDFSLSHRLSSAIIPGMIERSDDFDLAVTFWASRFRLPDGSPEAQLAWCRAAMRDWWRQNEKYFHSKEYRSVRPGPEPPWLLNSDWPQTAPKTTNEAPPEEPQKLGIGPNVAQVPAPNMEGPSTVRFAAFAAAAVALLACLFVKRSKGASWQSR